MPQSRRMDGSNPFSGANPLRLLAECAKHGF